MTIRAFLVVAVLGVVAGTSTLAQDSECKAGSAWVRVSGSVTTFEGAKLTLATRDGRTVEVDVTQAGELGRTRPFAPGMQVIVLGQRGGSGAIMAQSVARAKAAPGAWAPDCLSGGPP